MAYEVQRPPTEERRRLTEYETERYRLEPCAIYFEDRESSKPVTGSTFAWDADRALLREGKFELKEWVMKRLESIK